MLSDSIKKLGRFIRSEVEIWIKDNPTISADNLEGACAIASFTMYKCLIKLGHKPKLIIAASDDGDHCYLELNQHVIDLTATQFNMALPKVLITNIKYYTEVIPELQSYSVYKKNSAAVKYANSWDGQSPVIYSKNIRKIVRELNVRNYS